MADKKITELTVLESLELGDLLVVVDDPTGSPVTKKITLTTLATMFLKLAGGIVTGDLLFSGPSSGLAYGGMYQHEATNTITLNKDAYVKVDGFTSVGLLNEVSFVSDYALTVDTVGVYKLTWSINGSAVGNKVDLVFAIFVDGAEVPQGTGRTETKLAGEQFHIAANMLIEITNTSHEIDIRIMNLTDSTDLIIDGATFNLFQVGGNGS